MSVSIFDSRHGRLTSAVHDHGASVLAASVRYAVDAALQHCGQRLNRQGVRVSRVLADDIPPVPIAAADLTQTLIGLISDAAAAMPRGGRLLLWADRVSPERVALEIVDTGLGIAVRPRTRWFQPAGDATPGGADDSGVRLARRIIQRGGGSLNLARQPGLGSMIRIQLPIAVTKSR